MTRTKLSGGIVGLQGKDLFGQAGTRRQRALILPKYLADDGESFHLPGKKLDKAWEILKKWADMESAGQLAKKETALDADFLFEIFGEALGYTPQTQSPEKYHLERNFGVPGVGTADGALGIFPLESTEAPVAVIELKDAGTN